MKIKFKANVDNLKINEHILCMDGFIADTHRVGKLKLC